MKTFLKEKFKTLHFFYQYLGYRIFVLLGFSILMVLMDTIGLTMFVPLLQVAEGSANTSGSDEAGMILYVQSFFNTLGMELNVPNMLFFIVLLFVLKGLFFYFVLKYKGILLQSFSKKIRERLTLGIRDMDYKEFVGTDIGKMQNSLTGESWQVANASSLYLDVIKNGLFVFVYLLFAFFIDWRFSILVTIGGGITNLIYQRFYKRTQDLSRAITKNNHRYGAIVIEVINHFKYLKATGRNYFFTNRLNAELNTLIGNNISVAKLGARLSAMREPLMIIIIVAVMSVHLLVFKSPLSAIMVILLLFYRAMQAIMDLQNNWNNYLASIGSIENVISFQSYLDTYKEEDSGSEAIGEIEQIQLAHVGLHYGEKQVLQDVSLQIKRHESIALVGESGSGKTTLVNVLSALIPFDSGRLSVNGKPLDVFSKNDYRNKIGYISQEPTIFNATLFENVTFWAEKNAGNLAKYNQAIDMCSLRNFVTALPDGEDTLLGNNGINISGGQKQRVSIARELYRDVEILIMDEATSALDSETEYAIKESIEALQGKVTIVSIAHRLSTIRHTDRIYLMDDGRIVAEGSFEVLKDKSEYFRKLTELQGV